MDDIAFSRALVARFRQTHGVDPARVFALGFSGGGHFAYRLALEAPELVRAVAVFSAHLPSAEALDCQPRGQAISVFIVNGGADRINPAAGGDVLGPFGRHLGLVRSASDTERYFRGLAASSRGERVVLQVVPGAAHTLPGPDIRMPAALGRVERGYDGLGEALRFFSSLPAAPVQSSSALEGRSNTSSNGR